MQLCTKQYNSSFYSIFIGYTLHFNQSIICDISKKKKYVFVGLQKYSIVLVSTQITKRFSPQKK